MQKRWLIAFCGVSMQMMLGTAYAWSIFKLPLQQLHGWSSSELSWPFSIMIFFLGVSAAFGGKFVDKAGVRKVALLAGLLFGIGTLLTGYAIQIGNLPLLLVSYGVIAGIGNGLGYITPVATLVRWFPDRRGLITGIAVMGFGFGAGFIGQIAPFLIRNYGIAHTFYILGFIYLAVMLSSAMSFSNPPANWAEKFAKKVAKVKTTISSMEISLNQAIHMPQFYIMWLVFFVNIAAGVALLSNLSPMAQSTFGITSVQAGTLVLLTSLFNGLGRVFWSALSEKIGRKLTFMIIIYTQIPLLFLLPAINNAVIFGVASCYIVACMGGGFATMPAFVADIFGVKNMGTIYGKFLLAWSTAGVLGPVLMELSKQNFGSFNPAFYLIALTFLGMYIPLSHFLQPVQVVSKNTPSNPYVVIKKRVKKITIQIKKQFNKALTQQLPILTNLTHTTQ